MIGNPKCLADNTPFGDVGPVLGCQFLLAADEYRLRDILSLVTDPLAQNPSLIEMMVVTGRG